MSSKENGSSVCAILSVSVVLIAPLLFGIVIGSSGPTIDTMKNHVEDLNGNVLRLAADSKYVVFTPHQASWFTSLVTLGAMCGALVGGPLVNWLGFRKSLFLSTPVYIVSFATIGYLSNTTALFVARFCIGVCVGINSFLAPTYINEVSPTRLRGMLGASNQLAVTVGILLVYLMGSALTISGGDKFSKDGSLLIGLAPERSFCNWRLLALWNILPSLALGICVWFIPESPRWLAARGNLSEARKQLLRLRGDVYDAGDIEMLEVLVDSTKKVQEALASSVWENLWVAKRQVGIGIALQFFQQFSGINAIMCYCTTIMRSAHLAHPEMVSIGVMFEQVLFTLLACWLMDICGRRVLLLTGSAVMAVSCGLFGLYFLLSSFGAEGIAPMAYISVFLYMAAFSIGVGAIPWLILGEILPQNVRASGSSIATTANWIFAFIVTESLTTATEKFTSCGVMWTFGVFCIGLVFFTAFAVPETQGKTLEEIQSFFAPAGYKPIAEEAKSRQKRCFKSFFDEHDNRKVVPYFDDAFASSMRRMESKRVGGHPIVRDVDLI